MHGQRGGASTAATNLPVQTSAVAGRTLTQMRPLRYSINVTVDGCCDHLAVIPDVAMHRHHTENLARADAMLLGRVTYRMMEEAWRLPLPPGRFPDWMTPFAEVIDPMPKHVVSSTLDTVDWNAQLVRGDLATAVGDLKDAPGGEILTGGVTLPRALAALDLIDEYEFVVHSRIAGHGPWIFDGLPEPKDLVLQERFDLASGAQVLRYAPVRD